MSRATRQRGNRRPMPRQWARGNRCCARITNYLTASEDLKIPASALEEARRGAPGKRTSTWGAR